MGQSRAEALDSAERLSGGFLLLFTYWANGFGARLNGDWTTARRFSERDVQLSEAAALLDESLAISSELGMRPLMERVMSRREILGA